MVIILICGLNSARFSEKPGARDNTNVSGGDPGSTAGVVEGPVAMAKVVPPGALVPVGHDGKVVCTSTPLPSTGLATPPCMGVLRFRWDGGGRSTYPHVCQSPTFVVYETPLGTPVYLVRLTLIPNPPSQIMYPYGRVYGQKIGPL